MSTDVFLAARLLLVFPGFFSLPVFGRFIIPGVNDTQKELD
jgi:hypothetical protein